MYIKDPEIFKSLNGYTIDDIWYPRVTKIVDIKAKPALYRFYGEAENFAAGEQIKRQSATEGTLIHETVEKILIGGKPEIDNSISPAVNKFLEFLEEKSIQVDSEFVEKRIVNFDERYAGTIDAVALINGKFGILDIKTSQAIYRDYNLQTAAYMATPLSDLKNLQTRWILRIDQIKTCLKCGATLRSKGGRDKIKLPYPVSADVCEEEQHQWSELQGKVELQEFPYWKKDFEAFLGAKKLWEWENEYLLKQVGYLS